MDSLSYRNGSLSNRATPTSSASPRLNSIPSFSNMSPKPSSETLPLPEHPGVSFTNLASLKASPLAQLLHGKRKRDEQTTDEAIDFTTQKSLKCPTPSPVATAAPQNAKPGCSSCNGTHIKTGDILVTCANCPVTIHQQCSKPSIDEFRARDGSFLCKDCLLTGVGQLKLRRQIGASAAQQEDLERMRQRKLEALPTGVAPAKAELVGFKGGEASSQARFEYFDHVSRTDALNIISFADQLKPNLLTEILISISKRYPDLPLFDSPDWATRLPSSSTISSTKPHLPHVPRSIVKSQLNRPRHGHVLSHGKAKTRAGKLGEGQTKKVLKRTRIVEVPVEALPNGGEVDDVNDLPPSWKKAGPGLYADLPPDTEDRTWLVEDNDEEAFSHFMVSKDGRQIIDPL